MTTVVDLPIMKKPILNSVKNMKTHVERASSQVKVDVAFLAYLNDFNLKRVKELVEDGTIFGFCSSLSAPLNRKLEEITEAGLS